DEAALAVDNLDVQRPGPGDAPDVARRDRDRAASAHRTAGAQQPAAEPAPPSAGQPDAHEDAPPAGAQRAPRPPVDAALALRPPDQLPRGEGEGDEDRRQ